MLLPSKRPPGRLKSLLVKPDFPCIVVTLLTMTLATLITAALVLRYATADSGYGTFSTSQGPVCIVPINHGGDSAPAIVSAFNRCGRNSAGRGTVVFQNTTYTIKTVMETLNLENVDIDLQGTLSWDNSNITYWLDNSTPKDQPGQHGAAWWFGGKNVNWIGHGYGTLNGNGQAWYDYNAGRSNLAGRPFHMMIKNTSNSLFQGLRFLNSQMWTMSIEYSNNVILEDIYINSTSTNGSPTLNTDGADIYYSDNIHFYKWVVVNGDDSISPKANSTNIHISNCTFYNGAGIAIGSVGQYAGQHEHIENVTATNIRFHNTKHTAYIKTWTGVPKGSPPNGGGGGLGYAKNLHFSDFHLDKSGTGGVFTITQCTAFNNENGDCDTSKFQLSNIVLENFVGSTESANIAQMQCSADAPCPGIEIRNVTLYNWKTGHNANQYLCSSVQNPTGFKCTGGISGEDHGW